MFLVFVGSIAPTGHCEEYTPILFKNMELVYEDDFDKNGPHQNDDQWVIRQHTTWTVNGGILTGSLASIDYQKLMQAKNDGHDGTRTVIFLKPVPKAFVLRMRVRYNVTGKKGRDRGSLIDLGHHMNSFIFREDGGMLMLQKKKKHPLPKEFFPLNHWNEVTIEIREGELVATVNQRTLRFKDPLITLKSDKDQQVDFKGQDYGTVQIDWLKLYRGVD
jgi:hypothetical protein